MTIQSWRCVAKLDPERYHSDDLLRVVAHSPFDAIVLGGTSGVTRENTTDLALALRRRRIRVPVWQEISNGRAIAFGVDGYLVPIVLNATDVDYLAREHIQALRRYREQISWNHLMAVGYIVMHGDCAVGRKTKAEIPRDFYDVLALAEYGAKLCGLKALYIEYSGRLGDDDLVAQVRASLPSVQVFYGGGISSYEQLERFLSVASTVVVGNALYSNPTGVFDVATRKMV